MSRWHTEPISRTCESERDGPCNKPTTHAYEAMGGGWAALCRDHAQRHLDIAKPVDELIKLGEKWKP